MPIQSMNVQLYTYPNGNNLISFNIKNDICKTKAPLTHMYIELVISIQTTAQNEYERDR